MVLFGPALTFNHLKTPSSSIQFVPSVGTRVVNTALRPYSFFGSAGFALHYDVSGGEEITISYGSDTYFKERNIQADFSTHHTFQPINYSMDILREKGHCLTDIFVNSTTIPAASKGVFSKRRFKKNEVVSISPVLVVPKHVLQRNGRSSVLLNYCFASSEHDVAFLPTGTAAMINHGTGATANVGIRWFDWEGRDVLDLLQSVDVAKDLIGARSAPLHMEYFALRPLSAGEELLLDYGQEWEAVWRVYLQVLSHWMATTGGGDEVMLQAPQFRQPIQMPRNMLPDYILNMACAGAAAQCVESEVARSPAATSRRLNRDNSSILSQGAVNDLLMSSNEHHESIRVYNGSASKSTVQENVLIADDVVTSIPLTSSQECGLYLAPLPAATSSGNYDTQLGLFAGQDMTSGNILDIAGTMMVQVDLLQQLGIPPSHSMSSPYGHFAYVVSGAGAFARMDRKDYNAMRAFNTKNIARDVPFPQSQGLRPYSFSIDALYYLKQDVAPGSEIRVKMSNTSFSSEDRRHIHPQRSYDNTELSRKGHCVSDVHLASSSLPSAGKGVFVRRAFTTNETVSISPVLVVPKHNVLEDGTSVLINYCFASSEHDVAFLPTGTAAMINHGTGATANVGVRWFDWEGRDVLDLLQSVDVAKDLIGARSAPLHMEYFALRPLSAGEELLLDYGQEWEAVWRVYLQVLSHWMATTGGGDEVMLQAPQFRQPIQMPNGLIVSPAFQASDVKLCAGDVDCKGVARLRRPHMSSRDLNRVESTRLTPHILNMSEHYMTSSRTYGLQAIVLKAFRCVVSFLSNWFHVTGQCNQPCDDFHFSYYNNCLMTLSLV